MAEIRKIKRTAMILFCIICVVLVWYLFNAARGIWLTREMLNWNATLVAGSALNILAVLGALGISLSSLHSIRRKETPFTQKSVKKLKALAILLILFEPLRFAWEYLVQINNPIFISENSQARTTVHVSLGGSILAVGLVVYCVALVLSYGISLQNQIDETL